jgi:hypothetical protein
MFITKLCYKGIPEKDNLTDGTSGNTDGKNIGTFCYSGLSKNMFFSV